MKSPFPGMDPYLEQHWADVHTRMATYAADMIQEQLPGDLIARVNEYIHIENEDEWAEQQRRCAPDVVVSAERRSRGNGRQSAAVLTPPLRLRRIVEPFTQRSIEIVEAKSGNKIVTAIELLSPANKIGKVGREDYADKRKDLLGAKVSLVEIDLVRAGRPNLAIPLRMIPSPIRWSYIACVVRGWEQEDAYVYQMSLRESLPTIAIPLRKKDDDAALGLQRLIETVYEKGRYSLTDYSVEPDPLLHKDDADWADALLRKKRLR